MRIKVMVASRDEAVRAALLGAAWRENKMEVLAWVGTGEDIFSAFPEANPRLVIIDKDLEEDVLSLIRRIHETKEKCRVLVIGGRGDASFMYGVFKAKVSGYVGKPLDLAEVNEELAHISEDIREISMQAILDEAHASMRSLFFWKILFEDNDNARDMAFINRIAGVYFKPGQFRFVLFRFDRIDGVIPSFDQTYFADINYMQREIKRNINQYLYEYCYDMIYDFRFNGVLVLMNYDAGCEPLLKEKLAAIREESARYSIVNYATTITVCCGQAYDDFAEIRKSRDEAYRVSWTRLKHGTGKVLYFSKKYEMLDAYRQRLGSIIDSLKQTAQTLNIEEFHRLTGELFALPDYVLTDYHSKELVLEFVDTFFEVNGEVLAKHINIFDEKEIIKKTLNFSNTLADYERHLTESFDGMFELLAAELEKKNIRPLRRAIKYIKENYSTQITAETLAEVVNLNPVYFSHLFKKQTGMNMTDYIAEYRMEIAKKLLFETDMTIFEVAEAVGFQDQRYFSKRFRQIVGMTPTEYRKLK